MAVDLICFLGTSLVFIIPGYLFASILRLGKTALDQIMIGACLGLSLATYIAYFSSLIDLRAFYPIWGLFITATLFLWIRKSVWKSVVPMPRGSLGLLLFLLFLVGASRFAVAMLHEFPMGWDPAFHLILARKIQITQHAISDWLPFEPIRLNYPTGSHTLIVVWAAISRLPLETVFNLLIPFLGVLSTAIFFVFARGLTANDSIAVYASYAYGLWANFGSIGYYDWGGMPNEFSMLILIAVLAAWLTDSPFASRAAAMAIFLATLVLVHHHTMVAAAVLLAVITVWQLIFPATRKMGMLILIAGGIALVLDIGFVVPYATHIATLGSTGIAESEPITELTSIPNALGYALCLFAAVGIFFSIAQRKFQGVHATAFIGLLTMAVLYFATEYVRNQPVFTPSRFLTDANYFLAVFAGIGLWQFQKFFKLKPILMIVLILVGSVSNLALWKDESRISVWPKDRTSLTFPPGFFDACKWIRDNTSTDTLVLNDIKGDCRDWVAYLTWREQSDYLPIPVSEPVKQIKSREQKIDDLVSEQVASSTPNTAIIAILTDNPHNWPLIWSDPGHSIGIGMVWKPTMQK
jgi:hypothetical protein